MKTVYVGFLLFVATCVIAQNSPTYPVLTSIVLNGCDDGGSTPACANMVANLAAQPCVEGRTEVAFFRAGTTAITAATIQSMPKCVIEFYTSPWGSPTYWSGSSLDETAITSSLNSTGCAGGSCGTCFQDAWTTGIPAGATFIMVCGYFCVGTNDFTTLCANTGGANPTSPIYVIYFGAMTASGTACSSSSACGAGTDGGWDASGNYTNYSSTAATKGIEINMSSLVAGAPTLYYQYDVSSESNGNGAGATWGAGGTTTAGAASPTAYTSSGCNLPVVLPMSLIDFTAVKTEDNVMLKWTTATEINSDYFTVEYSFDGANFTSYKEVKGAGNSNEVRNYNCLFMLDMEGNTPYFRLKQVDKNGVYRYSNIISLDNIKALSNVITYYDANGADVINKFKLNVVSQISFSLYDVSGQEVYSSMNQFAEGDNQFLIPAPEVGGVYILVYQNGSSAPVHKKVMVTR